MAFGVVGQMTYYFHFREVSLATLLKMGCKKEAGAKEVHAKLVAFQTEMIGA